MKSRRDKISGGNKNGNRNNNEGEAMTGGGLEGQPGGDKISGGSKAGNGYDNGY